MEKKEIKKEIHESEIIENSDEDDNEGVISDDEDDNKEDNGISSLNQILNMKQITQSKIVN